LCYEPKTPGRSRLSKCHARQHSSSVNTPVRTLRIKGGRKKDRFARKSCCIGKGQPDHSTFRPAPVRQAHGWYPPKESKPFWDRVWSLASARNRCHCSCWSGAEYRTCKSSENASRATIVVGDGRKNQARILALSMKKHGCCVMFSENGVGATGMPPKTNEARPEMSPLSVPNYPWRGAANNARKLLI
jgi:hypothetical protein